MNCVVSIYMKNNLTVIILYTNYDTHTALIFNKIIYNVNSYPAKLNHLNFQPLKVVSRYRDPQFYVAKNY